jgi:hypothetical protein
MTHHDTNLGGSTQMKKDSSQTSGLRQKYEAPAVERVILDPIKEMLAACPQVGDGKSGLGCGTETNFS